MDINNKHLQIENLLKELENAPVECDGFCLLASKRLHQAGIETKKLCGTIEIGNKSIPHIWLEHENLIIDYRARMWLGEEAPHGAFTQTRGLNYVGTEIDNTIISDFLEIALLTPIDDQISRINKKRPSETV